jgi:hypothetical protein
VSKPASFDAPRALQSAKRAAGRPQDLADIRLLESLGDTP